MSTSSIAKRTIHLQGKDKVHFSILSHCKLNKKPHPSKRNSKRNIDFLHGIPDILYEIWRDLLVAGHLSGTLPMSLSTRSMKQ